MLRTREVAAAPVRSASATWAVIATLVADTVERSSSLTRAEAEQAMDAAAPVGRMLVAGGHLDRRPVTLITGMVYCQISTVSGTAALTLQENLNPVPGAAGAKDFTVYLPSPSPLEGLVEAAADGHPRLSAASPRKVPQPTQAAAGSGSLIDQDALRRAAGR
ncbi:hypothetical protein [Actinoallomurus sp. CA-142502]|uniref:hypothetical protein n=1 Tax=Actinoallomurus sp. CA-142502 TaxID=3239885 RepID=UPI003D8F88DD